MAIQIVPRRRLAIWYQCPQCKRSGSYQHMTPTKKHRDWVGTCIDCDVQEVIVRRRYYMIWSCDFYGTAGSCKEICEYYFPNIRAFKKWIAERTAELQKQAEEYYEQQRVIDAEYQARVKKQREEAALLEQVERVAYQTVHAVELQAEQIAKSVWPEVESVDLIESDLSDLSDLGEIEDHPF